MNMKKTIAAISAAAVAVSAMATTVNAAFDRQELTFNLCEKGMEDVMGTATFTAVFNDGSETTDYFVFNPAAGVGSGWGEVSFENISWTVTSTDAEGRVQTVVINKNSGAIAAAMDGNTSTPGIDLSSVRTWAAGTDVTVSVTVEHNAWNNFNTTGGQNATITGTSDVKTGTALTSFTNFSQKLSGDVYPMLTTLNGIEHDELTHDLIEYLECADLNGDWAPSPYTNVRAVLNDAAVNYDNISVTFYTAANKVNGDGKYDDNGSIDCRSFGQQVYNTYAGNTGYINYNWTGFNLFNGALVVNKYLTMSLADVNSFTYSADSMTFSWNTVMETNSGAAINPYATYVQSIDFITSTNWYWDHVTFVLENAEGEDVNVGEGIDGETDTLEDDDDDIDLGDDDDDIDLGEDDDDDIDVDVEIDLPTEDEPVANVETGNASVALAVIPVALAAAAIIAKKRG